MTRRGRILDPGEGDITTYTFNTGSLSSSDGPVSATASIDVTAGANGTTVLTVTLTDTTLNPTSVGQALSSLQIMFAAAPPKVSSLAANGTLVQASNGEWVTDTSDKITHWGTEVSGDSLWLATAGTGSVGGKPVDLIADTAGGASNANASFGSHSPSIANSATFTITLASPPSAITGVKFGFGTTPDYTTGVIAPTICFMAGTQIALAHGGAAAVEDLQPGDLVLTHDGRHAPVLWVGRQTVSRRFADPVRSLPVRIAAGALGGSLPARDLLVSRQHALLVDGVLAEAGALINGRTIAPEIDVPETFVFYHVETEDHSLILAEGVPSETFIDHVGRLAFDNWQEQVSLFPHGRHIVELPYARAQSVRQLPRAIRERLETQADALLGPAVAAA